MMELYIETLTGAAFELRVSPFETIRSVKAKIQRLEGAFLLPPPRTKQEAGQKEETVQRSVLYVWDFVVAGNDAPLICCRAVVSFWQHKFAFSLISEVPIMRITDDS